MTNSNQLVPIAGDRFLVIGNGRWGKGPDLASAKVKYKEHGGKLSTYVAVEATQPEDGHVLDIWVSGEAPFTSTGKKATTGRAPRCSRWSLRGSSG